LEPGNRGIFPGHEQKKEIEQNNGRGTQVVRWNETGKEKEGERIVISTNGGAKKSTTSGLYEKEENKISIGGGE